MSLPAKSRPRAYLPLLLSAVLTLCSLLFACAGYQLATSSPSVLGDSGKTLKVKGVDYPTLQPWLPYQIRSALRDEINARYLAQWVDSGPADYTIQINVISYTTRELARNRFDNTQLYNSNMVIQAIVYDGGTNKEFWRSGHIAYAERQAQVDEKSAADDIIVQIIRMLADEMRNSF